MAAGAVVDRSPRGDRLRDLAWMARNGRAAVAQRKTLGGLFGAAVQFRDDGEPAEALIAEDSVSELAPGQMTKAAFLGALHERLMAVGAEEYDGTDWTASDCPYIERWFEANAGKPAAHIERLVRKYGSAPADASCLELIRRVGERARLGFREQARSGAVTQLPEDLPLEPATPASALQRMAARAFGGGAPAADAGVLQRTSGGVVQLGNRRGREKVRPEIISSLEPYKDEKQEEKGDLRQQAARLFNNARIINFTKPGHQLFSDVREGEFGDLQGATWTGKPLDHLVNKWERSEGGEEGLVGYTQDSKGILTANAEAHQFGMNPEEYIKLPSRQKMQFAVLDYPGAKNKGGWGQSFFVIRRDKCLKDGVIHFGDSAVSSFGGGRHPFGKFSDMLLESQDLASMIVNPSGWIEVNLQGGVLIPDDIEEFHVSLAELKAFTPFAPQQDIEVMKRVLEKHFAKVVYV